MAQTLPCYPRSSYHLPLDQPKEIVNAVFAAELQDAGLVLHNGAPYGDRPNAVEYEILSDCGGTYRLDIKAAALEARPVRVLLNGQLVEPQALANPTGGWNAVNQRWFEAQAVLPLVKGSNRLRIERGSVFPHISEIELLLCRTPGFCQDFDLTGIWTSLTDSRQFQFIQLGNEIVGVNVNPDFAHLINGRFTEASRIQGTFEHRIDRRDGRNRCDTKMSFEIRFISQNKFELKWTALDSKCDLQQGTQSPWLPFERVL
ncbi:MAG: hypothetical protein ABUT39_05405 [Acidobacteriota bacterium]